MTSSEFEADTTGRNHLSDYLATGRTLRPLGKLWPFLKWCLILCIIISCAGFVSGVVYGQVINSNGPSHPALVSLDIFEAAIAIVWIVVSISTMIAYSRFMHRAMNNVHVCDGPEGLVSPSGTWLWFIVPIACLWMPFRAVIQIWRSSHGYIGQPEDPSRWIYIWWGCLWASNFISFASGYFFTPESGVMSSLLGWSFLYAVTDVMASYALLKTASGIAAAQAQMGNKGIEDVFS